MNINRNYIIGTFAVVAIALIGFFFYDNSSNVEVADANEKPLEVIVVAEGNTDPKADESTSDENHEVVHAVEKTEKANDVATE